MRFSFDSNSVLLATAVASVFLALYFFTVRFIETPQVNPPGPRRLRFSMRWILTATACVAINLFPYTHGEAVVEWMPTYLTQWIAAATLVFIMVVGPMLAIRVLLRPTWWKLLYWWACLGIVIGLLLPPV